MNRKIKVAITILVLSTFPLWIFPFGLFKVMLVLFEMAKDMFYELHDRIWNEAPFIDGQGDV